jgi:uncharacterized phage protein (TIGR01671 family)
MREIKFRAWNSYSKTMLNNVMYFDQRDGYVGINVITPTASRITAIMQFTGLHDKNGKEIYEGDVVKVSEPDEDSCMGKEFVYNCEVCFGGGEYRGCFTLKCEEYYRGFALLGYSRNAELEVIGNIYENPELLELKR